MLTILLLVILAWSFYIGFSRGIILQSFYTVGAILATIFASSVYRPWSKLISLWVPFINATQGSKTYFFSQAQLFRLSEVFYAGLSFLIAYTIFYCGWRVLGIFLHMIPEEWESRKWTKYLSGFLAVLVTAYSMQILLVTLSTIPMDLVQNQLNRSSLAHFLIQQMPFTSNFLKGLFVTKIIG